MSEKIRKARRAYLARRDELVDALKEARSRQEETARGQQASAAEAQQTFPALRGRS